MVGRYPAIQLMPREPIRHLVAHFSVSRCRKTEYEGLVAVSAGYPSVTGRLLTRYAPFRRSPSKSIATLHAAPRLACVKPAASVHPEPGSNSSLYISYILLVCLAVLTSLALLASCLSSLFNELLFYRTSRLPPILCAPFSFGDCKGTLFFFPSKSFFPFSEEKSLFHERTIKADWLSVCRNN